MAQEHRTFQQAVQALAPAQQRNALQSHSQGLGLVHEHVHRDHNPDSAPQIASLAASKGLASQQRQFVHLVVRVPDHHHMALLDNQ
jgi:hypothetical protein